MRETTSLFFIMGVLLSPRIAQAQFGGPGTSYPGGIYGGRALPGIALSQFGVPGTSPGMGIYGGPFLPAMPATLTPSGTTRPHWEQGVHGPMITPANRFQIPGGMTDIPIIPGKSNLLGGTYTPDNVFQSRVSTLPVSGNPPISQAIAEFEKAQANAPIVPPLKLQQIPKFEMKDFKPPTSPSPSCSQKPILPAKDFLGWAGLVVAIIFVIAFLGGFIEAFQGSARRA
jgi:hypothetical protein